MNFKLIIDPSKEEEVMVTVHRRSALTDEIEALILAHTGADTVFGCREDEWRMLSFQEIECITTINGKVFAIDSKGTRYRLKQRLYELEEILPFCFIRINKSAIANERLIERFAANFSGAVDAVFQGGYREYVSRRCFAEIKRRYRL